MVVRELVATFGVKTDSQSFQKAEGGMNKLASVAKAAAAAIAGFVAVKWLRDVTKEVAALGDQWDKMSKRTGIASDTLQRFSHAAELSGASIKEIEGGIKKLQAAQSDAAFGLQTYTREFERIGVEIKDETGKFKDAEQLLIEIADGMKRLPTDTERTAVAMKLMGRGGTTLIPLLKEGGDAVRAMMNEVGELGALMDKEAIQAAADYTDNMQRMSMAFMGVKLAIGKHLLPMIIKLQEQFIAWWKDNKDEIKKFVDRVWGAVKILGGLVNAFLTIGKAIYKLFAALPGVVKILALVVAFMHWGKGMFILGKAVRFLFSPFGKLMALIVLLGLIIEDLVVWVEGGDSVFGRFFETLDELLGINVSGPIKDMIKWFMSLAQDPVAAIEQLGQEWIVVFEELWSSIKAGLDSVLSFFGTSVDEIANFWSNIYDSVVEWGSKIWDWVVGWADRIVEKIPGPFKAAGKFISGLVGGGGEGGTAGKPKVMGSNLPPLPVSPRGGGNSLAQNTNVQINVKALPGMDEKRLANEVGRQFHNEKNRQNRAAMRALVPGTAGG